MPKRCAPGRIRLSRPLLPAAEFFADKFLEVILKKGLSEK